MKNLILNSEQTKKVTDVLSVELEVLVQCFYDETDDLKDLEQEIRLIVETLIQLDYEPTTVMSIDGYKLVGMWEG